MSSWLWPIRTSANDSIMSETEQHSKMIHETEKEFIKIRGLLEKLNSSCDNDNLSNVKYKWAKIEHNFSSMTKNLMEENKQLKEKVGILEQQLEKEKEETERKGDCQNELRKCSSSKAEHENEHAKKLELLRDELTLREKEVDLLELQGRECNIRREHCEQSHKKSLNSFARRVRRMV